MTVGFRGDAAALRGGWLSLLYALILFIFFDIKSRREEMWLRAKYVDYADYQQRVPRFIPRIGAAHAVVKPAFERGSAIEADIR